MFTSKNKNKVSVGINFASEDMCMKFKHAFIRVVGHPWCGH